MKKIKWGIILASTLVLFLGCKNTITVNDEGPHTIKIIEAMDKKEGILLSELIQGEIEYVCLETNEECLLNNNSRFYLNETEIIAFTKQQVFVFDRETGKFLREIGHYGRDPGGYRNTVYSYPFDEKNKLIYLGSWESQVYLRYNSSGELKDKITAYSDNEDSDFLKSQFGEIVTSIAPLNDTCFVGHVWNINGKQKTKLIIFNENNHRIKTYPQYKTFEWDLFKDGLSVFHWDGWFYEYNNMLNFFERSTDTIFSVSIENLKPRYVFDGEAAIENISESNRFLLFNLKKEKGLYCGIFDKNNKETKIAKLQDGIENDVDHFIPFSFYSVNNKGEITGFQEAYKVVEWFSNNPQKITNLPPHLQKLRNINENDNPVVMIAKLKE
jgi:hypothetical protein